MHAHTYTHTYTSTHRFAIGVYRLRIVRYSSIDSGLSDEGLQQNRKQSTVTHAAMTKLKPRYNQGYKHDYGIKICKPTTSCIIYTN